VEGRKVDCDLGNYFARVPLVVRMTVEPCASRGGESRKEVMSKMIDGKSSLKSIGAAGVIIWK